MKTITKEVFEEIEKPDVNSPEFKALSLGEQLKLANAYKEYALEMKVYGKVLETGKSVNEIFDNDAEIDADKKDLALTRFAMLKEIGSSDRSYTDAFSRHSYRFEGGKTKDVETRFEILRDVKTFSIKNYLSPEQQTIGYGWFQ